MSVQPEVARVRKDGSFTVVSDEEQYPDIPVTTLHLSCASDVYEGPSSNYAGFVLYAHNGLTMWTLNGRKCRTGYIVIQDTDSPAVQRCIPNSEGVVHGAVYKNVFDTEKVTFERQATDWVWELQPSRPGLEGKTFLAVFKVVIGEDVGDTVGEAFSVMKGEFKWKSGTFNNRTYHTSHYHDGGRGMSTVSQKCVSEVLKLWMDAGLKECCVPCMRNYTVDELK